MADQPLQPIDWTGLKPAVLDGPRHYSGSEANAKHPWKCPACGGENVGLLGEGCISCGGGGGARHKGIDPIVVKGAKAAPEVTAYTLQPTSVLAADDLTVAFWAYVNSRTPRASLPDPYETFKAGWTAACQLRGAPVPTAGSADESSVQPVADEPTVDPALVGTARSRTILAALIFFKEQVLSQQPEEIGTGEWLSQLETAVLIAEMQTSQEQTHE